MAGQVSAGKRNDYRIVAADHYADHGNLCDRHPEFRACELHRFLATLTPPRVPADVGAASRVSVYRLAAPL
jgi:hypothetical protein